jgi:hypothetical protein
MDEKLDLINYLVQTWDFTTIEALTFRGAVDH